MRRSSVTYRLLAFLASCMVTAASLPHSPYPLPPKGPEPGTGTHFEGGVPAAFNSASTRARTVWLYQPAPHGARPTPNWSLLYVHRPTARAGSSSSSGNGGGGLYIEVRKAHPRARALTLLEHHGRPPTRPGIHTAQLGTVIEKNLPGLVSAAREHPLDEVGLRAWM